MTLSQFPNEVPTAAHPEALQPAEHLPGQLLVAQLPGRVGPVVLHVDGEADSAGHGGIVAPINLFAVRPHP